MGQKDAELREPYSVALLRTRIPAGRSVEDAGAIGRGVASMGWLRSWKADLREFLDLSSILLLRRRGKVNVTGRIRGIVEMWRS